MEKTRKDALAFGAAMGFMWLVIAGVFLGLLSLFSGDGHVPAAFQVAAGAVTTGLLCAYGYSQGRKEQKQDGR